ncbi:hypothetical protein N9T15_00290 [Pelagibacteraceae bacterium]|nr:hypothetical protein [Pelagibacteraceae bacterium]
MPELEITQDNIDEMLESLKVKKKIVLEVGFGGGENLLNMIEGDEESYYIGCEPYLNGMTNFLINLDKKYYEIVKVFKNDVRVLLYHAPKSFFNNIFILFPDPWPKQRHRKRKMINKENAELLVDKLKNKGKVYLATDVEKYFFEMVDVFNNLQNVCIINKDNFRLRPNLIVSTRYERKAIEKKNQPFFLVIKKNLD